MTTHIDMQGLQTTLPFTLGVYMVRDFLTTTDNLPSEQVVGKLTGLLGSAFCGAQLITSYPLGILSDRIGRKPILIIGNLSCVLGILWFGLSRSYAMAVAARFVSGALNAIIGAEKSIIGELLDPQDQGKAMSWLSLAWGVGVLIGPALGGSLAMPCSSIDDDGTTHQSSSVFCGPRSLLATRPYFLPCLVAAAISLITLIMTAIYLEESLPSKRKNTSFLLPKYSGDADDLELVGLQPSKKSKGSAHSLTLEEDLEFIPEEPAPLPQSPSFSMALPWYHQKTIILCLAGYGVVAFIYSLLDETVPLFASSPAAEGGLGFSPHQLAGPLSFGGLVLVFWALFGYPWMLQHLGPIRSCKNGLWTSIPMCLLIPLASLPSSIFGKQFIMWIAMGLKAITATNSFTSCIILVNLVSPPESLGAINGIGQTIASFVRAAGPALGGVAWSLSLAIKEGVGMEWGHQCLPFVFAIFMSACALFLYTKVELSPQQERTIAQKK